MCVCVLFFVSIVLLNWLFNVKWLFVEPDCLEYATHLIVSTHCCEVFSKLLCFRRWLRFETFFCGLLWRHWCDAFVVWRHWCYFIGVTPLVVGVTSLQWHHWCVSHGNGMTSWREQRRSLVVHVYSHVSTRVRVRGEVCVSVAPPTWRSSCSSSCLFICSRSL